MYSLVQHMTQWSLVYFIERKKAAQRPMARTASCLLALLFMLPHDQL